MSLINEIIGEVESTNEIVGEVETLKELIGEIDTVNELTGDIETSIELVGEIDTFNELIGEVENQHEIIGEVSIGASVGTLNYNHLLNKPQINNIELVGNKSLDNLQIQGKMDKVTNTELDNIFSDL